MKLKGLVIMGYIVTTKTNQYNLEDTGNPKIKLISGGEFRQNEIYLPIDFKIGSSFKVKFTRNKCNEGFDKTFDGSEIINIRETPYVQIARPNVQTSKIVKNAGQFFVMDNSCRDIGKILQSNRENIECDVCDELGIEDSKKQRIFISDTVFNETGSYEPSEPSQCVVVFSDFDCSDIGYSDIDIFKSLSAKIYDYLDEDCVCSEPMFIEKSNLHFISQKYSDKSLGLDNDSKLKNAIKTLIKPKNDEHDLISISSDIDLLDFTPSLQI